jgi:outer membrane protein TolC
MADEFEDPNQAADRLEAALERIASLTAAPPRTPDSPGPSVGPIPDTDLTVTEIAERLDVLITRLRAALSDTAKPD